MTRKPDAAHRTDHYRLGDDQIKDLIKSGFMRDHFLDGKPGTAQTVEFSFDLGHEPTVTVTVFTTLK